MRQRLTLSHTFRSMGRELGLHIEVTGHRLTVISPLWRKALSTASSFCRAVVAAGYLTERQMLRAASRYRLGGSRRGGVIFWQIDHEGRIHDGKVMYYRDDCHRDKDHRPTWVSTLLRRRCRWADDDRLYTTHCLFGLHLLSERRPWRGNDVRTVCVVEAEKTAVILSEHYPDCLWMATGGLSELQPEKLRPLHGRQVILFPDTDPDGTAFRRWHDTARLTMAQPYWEHCPPIRVSPLLELQATPEQKARKIDLIDFRFERQEPLPHEPQTPRTT